MLNTNISETFLGLFSNEIECDIEDTNSKLNLRVLNIRNNRFCYSELVEELSNAVISFALSRKEFADLEKKRRYGSLYNRAIEKFKDYHLNEGEAGELLLYCFLESHLKAPKILTKLELKTSSEDYVKGSDGIHLLKLSDRDYQLVFGESKLDAKLTTSISQAFKSISDFINRPKNNIHSEIGLISSELGKEACDEYMYEFLKSIIYPRADSKEAINRDDAFAIFAGFEVDVDDLAKKMTNSEFRSFLVEKVKAEVEGKKNHIRKKIEEYDLYGYTFYVYAFPFTELASTRKDIIKKLTKG